jgi:hypothetical protein
MQWLALGPGHRARAGLSPVAARRRNGDPAVQKAVTTINDEPVKEARTASFAAAQISPGGILRACGA